METAERLLSCDWGTTSLRLRLVEIEPLVRIISEYRSDEGAASIAARADEATRADQFKEALRRAVRVLANVAGAAIDHLPIIISGMAGSSIGWQSLPYARLPFELTGTDAVANTIQFDGHRVVLMSGVRTDLDVMRGEETELIGLMQLPEVRAAGDRLLAILPGTHSKHAGIIDGRLVSFRTYMTGEMYCVMGQHSVLRHSICASGQTAPLELVTDEPTRNSFLAGVRAALAGDLLSAMFQTRARQLLENQSVQSNTAFLSGVLIGSEISPLRNRSKAEGPIVLAAGSAVSPWYAAALSAAGLGDRSVVIAPRQAEQLSSMGHASFYRTIRRREFSDHERWPMLDHQ